MKDKPLCEVCGSDRRVFLNKKLNKYLCDNHRQEVIQHGKILNRRKLTDPNEIIKHSAYAEIVLYNINYLERARCKISLDKVDKVKNYKWSLHSAGYVSTNIGDKVLLLHRYITDCPDNMEVDHINRDRLDFRNENLRICHSFENSMNKDIREDNSSGVTGVCYDKERDKWQIRLWYKGRKLFKRLDGFDDAVCTRLKWESRYFKEYSPNYNHDTNTIQLTYLSHDDNQQTYIEVDMDGNILKFEKLN